MRGIGAPSSGKMEFNAKLGEHCMFYETGQGNGGLPFDPIKAIVTPRPIGWISTVDAEGRPNLAPYSFFNLVSARPAVVGFSSEGLKHSAANAMFNKEFVCNFAGMDFVDEMNLSSLPLAAGDSEFELSGLQTEASRLVSAPRVRGVFASLECKVVDHIAIKDSADVPTNWHLILGEVVGVFIDDAVVRDGRFDTARARPLARCGYRDYAMVDRIFELKRYSDG